uniref:TFIIS central domain-containing protein n=1 Tax=Syphacia muris TaxID=451379 RepID=A0A0N5ADZ9_9BILA
MVGTDNLSEKKSSSDDEKILLIEDVETEILDSSKPIEGSLDLEHNCEKLVTENIAERLVMAPQVEQIAAKEEMKLVDAEKSHEDLGDTPRKRKRSHSLSNSQVTDNENMKNDLKLQSENSLEPTKSDATENKTENVLSGDSVDGESDSKIKSDSEKQVDIPTKRIRSSSSSDSPTDKRRKSNDNNDDETEVREKSIAMIEKAIRSNEAVHKLANTIEEAIYSEFHDANDHRYRSRVRSRVSNLNRNPAICSQLLFGKIKPDQFARMTADELATREMKEFREEMESSIDEHLLPEHEVVGTENCKKSENAV